MGLSASQARLLSITARLSNNELQAQLITNAKLRLAEKSNEVSKKYTESISASKLQFQYYDDNGDSQSYDLTPKFIYSYEPLKNQYAIKNSATDKSIVNELDSKNYEKSNTLDEFLDCYNLLDDVQDQKTVTVPNPDHTDWESQYAHWLKNKPVSTDYVKTTSTTKTITKLFHENSVVYEDLQKKIGLCFGITHNYKQNCFMHVLSALIGFGEHTTTDGHTFTVYPEEDIGWSWNSYQKNGEEIGDEDRKTLFTDDCSNEAYDGDLLTEAHGTVPCKGTGEDAAKYNNGTTDGKGYCYQKAVDLLWEVHDAYNGTPTGGTATEENLQKFWYFVEFDLGTHYLKDVDETITTSEPDPEAYNKALEEWQKSEPVEPPRTVEKVVSEKYITINDIPKGQWYVNLWYMMNGSKTANKIRQKEVTLADGTAKTLNIVEGAAKSTAVSPAYTVLDANLASDGNWMKYALENGIITLVQAKYLNLDEESGRVTEVAKDGYNWEDIGYQNAADITSAEDGVKVKEGQVQYEKDTASIEEKDKEYDHKLKNLDTEHNALQTEYDTVKSVISKNVERSYKSFMS